ncbi:MAG: S8 family serine peptidase, partial [Gammaproteobacteria bacterium]|nr:S8 family serine peptidase [Gammaproteobacteria bacterium]
MSGHISRTLPWLLLALSHQAVAVTPELAVRAAQLKPGTYSLTEKSAQGILHYQPPTQRWIVMLKQPALYPSLEQLARSELKGAASYKGQNSHVQAESLQQQMLELKRNSSVVQQLSRTIEDAQRQVTQQITQTGKARVEQHFSLLTNSLVVSGDVKQAQLKAMNGVVAVFPEQSYGIALQHSVPKVKAPEVWALKDNSGRQITGQGIRIAVLDTGVDFTHPALGGCIGAGCKVVAARNTILNNDDVTDVNSHGTHVAATALGKDTNGNGVAPDASLIAVKVMGDDGFGIDSSILAGLDFALDPDGDPATDDAADVINLSLGGPGNENSPLSQAVNAAVQSGVVVVVAAGNNYDYLSISSPGTAKDAITVSNANSNDQIEGSSSRGPLQDASFLKPDLSAPGTDIMAAKPGGGYQSKTGTSMAAPHVAGAAALLLQADPNLTPAQIKHKLVHSADKISANVAETGAGRLNVFNALKQSIYLDTQAFLLGRVGSETTTFTGNRQFVVHNPTSTTLDINLSTSDVPSYMSVMLAQTAIQLMPGQQQTVSFSFSATSADIPLSVNNAGVHSFAIELSSPNQQLRLPVLFEKYNELAVESSGSFNFVRAFDKDWQQTITFSLSGITGTKRLRYVSEAPVYLIADARLMDPRSNEGRHFYISGYLLKMLPPLNQQDHKISLDTAELNEYHKLSTQTLSGQTIDFSRQSISTESFSLYRGTQQIIDPTYTLTFCTDCIVPTQQFITGGFPAEDWTFFSVLTLPNLQSASPEIYETTWHRPVGQGDQTQQKDFSAKDQVKITIPELANQQFLGSGSGINVIWDEPVKAGDSVSYLFNGETRNVFTAPTLRTMSMEGLIPEMVLSTGPFSISEQGHMVKLHPATDEQGLLIPVLDTGLSQIPITSNLKYSRLAMSSQYDQSYFVFWEAPQQAHSPHQPKIWVDQYLNYAAFTEQTHSELMCANTTYMDVLWFYHYGPHYWSSTDCQSLKLHIPESPKNPSSAGLSVTYLSEADSNYPVLTSMQLFNQKQQSDVVSRIDHELHLAVTTDETSPLVALELDIRTEESDWRRIYQSEQDGQHKLKLPLTADTKHLDLRLTTRQENGNQMQQILPAVITIGANAGGDNDVDSDGIPNQLDSDNDNDGIADTADAVPYDPNDSVDSDTDGVGNNADPDDDNDGVSDTHDAFPFDPNESVDTDSDGTGNNTDPDDDNDGVGDSLDTFPLDPNESVDTDSDGIGNNTDPDDDNDGVADVNDAFPLDAKESLDTDQDGIGNNTDPDDDNDAVTDSNDAFPLDPKESVDTDKDGIGNNADPDDDNDGVADSADAYPLDPTRSVLPPPPPV